MAEVGRGVQSRLGLDGGRGAADGPPPDGGVIDHRWRLWGWRWVAGTLPVAALVAAFVGSPAAYVCVVILLAFGVYTMPGLFVGWRATQGAAPGDRLGYLLLWLGQWATVAMGLSVLVGLVTGWRAALYAMVPLAAVTGTLHVAGLAAVVRRRSGQQALSVDVAETLSSVVAVAAPLAVLGWPVIVGADESWFTLGVSVIFLFTVAATYWVALLWVRLGPGPRGSLEGWVAAGGVVAAAVGSITAGLQVANGAAGFTWPAPPLVLLCALCGSTYLLIPLHAPMLWRDEFERLPPEAQVRGAWLPAVVPLAGIVALLGATAAVADERRWAVPFALGVVAALAMLGAIRQVATLRETRALYQQVEASAGERRLLLTELLHRSVADRRAVAEKLHSQAMSAYASFTTLAAADRSTPVLSQASEMVGNDLRRSAESLHDLIQSMRPPAGTRREPQLVAPIRAYLATTYGDAARPALTVTIAEGVDLDWVVEAVALQVVQEALDNVWRHSGASTVRVDVDAFGGVASIRVVDDGRGFDPATRPEAGGLATMRAAAAVLDGDVRVDTAPGGGTTVTARLGPLGTGDAPVLKAVPTPGR